MKQYRAPQRPASESEAMNLHLCCWNVCGAPRAARYGHVSGQRASETDARVMARRNKSITSAF